MDANPSNRQTASYIYDELLRLYEIVYSGVAKGRDGLAILKAFEFTNAIIPTLRGFKVNK